MRYHGPDGALTPEPEVTERRVFAVIRVAVASVRVRVLCGNAVQAVHTRSTPAKKYPISYATVSDASDPCVALRSMDCANSLRSVPASAFAGSVAPISARHLRMASAASRTRTIAGPDDMNAVRLPKNGRSRCTA